MLRRALSRGPLPRDLARRLARAGSEGISIRNDVESCVGCVHQKCCCGPKDDRQENDISPCLLYTSTLAQYFLSLLPDAVDAYHEGRKRLIRDVTNLYEDLRTIPHLEVYPTGANFLLFKVRNGMTASELQTRLLVEHEMYVRDCSNKLGMDAFHIRVASQGRQKDTRLVEALRTLLQ